MENITNLYTNRNARLITCLALAWLSPFAAFAAMPDAPYDGLGSIKTGDALNPSIIHIRPRIILNGVDAGNVGAEFILHNNHIYSTHANLIKVGVWLNEQECPDTITSIIPEIPSGYFDIQSCKAITASYNHQKQELNIDTDIHRLNRPTTYINQLVPRQDWQLSSAGNSLVYNYDLSVGGSQQGNTSGGLYSSIRAGTAFGFFQTEYTTSFGSGSPKSERGQTFWKTSWPKNGISLVLGDSYMSGANLSSNTPFAGIQVSKNYDSMPWFQKLPQPIFSSTLQYPSTIDMYLDGVKQYSQDISSGPYEMRLPPSFSNGVAQIVVTDSLGRKTLEEVPLYDASDLLSPGLNEWSLEVGHLRVHAGKYSNRPMFSGSIRQGLNNRLTGQAHIEVSDSYKLLSLGVHSSPPLLDKLNLEISRSQSGNKNGHQGRIFGLKTGKNWSVAGGLITNSSSFYSMTEDANNKINPNPISNNTRRQSYITGGWQTKHIGNFNISKAKSLSPFNQSDILSLGWSKQINQSIGINASASHDKKGSSHVFLSITGQFNKDIAASTTITQSNQGGFRQSTQLQQLPRDVGQIGWDVGVMSGGAQKPTVTAGFRKSSQYGDGEARISHSGTDVSWRGGWRGAVAFMDSSYHLTRPISESFAAVSTSLPQGIPIYLQNNFVGKTDARGKLFIPNLIPYYENRVSIDANQIPTDTALKNSSQIIIPPEKSGVLVKFNTDKIYAKKFRAVLTSSEKVNFVPLGASVINQFNLPQTVVGYDGMVYLENQKDSAIFLVKWVDDNNRPNTCQLTIPANLTNNSGVLNLGDIPCEPFSQ